MEPIPVDLACDAQGTAAVIARSSEERSSHCEYSNLEEQQQQEEAPGPAPGAAARFALMSPFRTMRHRLFTEETLPIQNTTSNTTTTSRIPLVANRTRTLSQSQQTLTIGMSRTPSVETDISFTVPVDLEATPHTMTDKNPFLSQEDDGDDEQDHGEQREDEQMMSGLSTVSSISKDSARRINHNAIDDPAAIARAPPAEIFVRSRSNESSGISSNSVPRISLVLPTTPPRIPNQNVIPLWQQNWVQGEIMAAHQTSATATAAATAIVGAGGRLSPPRPPHIVTSSPSPLLPRPVAPKHEAEAAEAAGAAPSHWQTVQPQTLPPQEPTSPPPPLRRQNRRCVVSVTSPHKEGQLEKHTVVSPNLARVNTDTSRTATTMATSPTTTTLTCEPPHNHHHHHSQTRPILLQRPVIVTRAATAPCVTSKFTPVTPVTDQIMSSEHLGTPRPQHTHSQSVGSVGDHDRDHNHPKQQLLGDRPRRKVIRGSATVFSFGSIVGQSSILTPTSNTTPTGSSNQSPARQFGQMVKANRKLAKEAARTIKDDGSFMSSTRRKSAVQQDIEFLWKRVVAKPVRRWTGTEERIDLQRSSTGCLT